MQPHLPMMSNPRMSVTTAGAPMNVVAPPSSLPRQSSPYMRPPMYEKNKRSTYSNDLRNNSTGPTGPSGATTAQILQQSAPTTSSMYGVQQPQLQQPPLPMSQGPIRQKKRKRLTEKVIHKQIRSLVPESQAYIELLRLEQKLDTTLMRKRLDLQETLKRPQKTKKKLRIFISHQYPVRFDPESNLDEDNMVQYWEMRVEGRLLDDVNRDFVLFYIALASKYDLGKTKRKFSSFFRSLVIELDKDLYGPDNHLVEWHRTNATSETDGFQVRRPGDQNVKCTILMLLDHQYRLENRLARLLSLSTGTRQTIIHAMWQYIKTHKLQDSEEREFINCDAHLQSIFDCSKMRFSDLPGRLNKLILPPEPIIINHTLCIDGTDPKKHACYDIDVEIDDPIRDTMRTFLSPQNTHELEDLDGKILQYIDSINQLKQSREFYLSFADDPQGFICKWLASQSRDLRIMTDQNGNTEEERRSEYYYEQWSVEAVSRYFYNKVQQKRAELEQALATNIHHGLSNSQVATVSRFKFIRNNIINAVTGTNNKSIEKDEMNKTETIQKTTKNDDEQFQRLNKSIIKTPLLNTLANLTVEKTDKVVTSTQNLSLVRQTIPASSIVKTIANKYKWLRVRSSKRRPIINNTLVLDRRVLNGRVSKTNQIKNISLSSHLVRIRGIGFNTANNGKSLQRLQSDSSNRSLIVKKPDNTLLKARFLNGRCKNTDCLYSHIAIPGKVPTCTYFIKGACGQDHCPYAHSYVGNDAKICDDFVQGYCKNGIEFESTGSCSHGNSCHLLHRRKQKDKLKRKTKKIDNKKAENNQKLLSPQCEILSYIPLDQGIVESSPKTPLSVQTVPLSELKLRPSFL
ncbi:unnamed protein product [Didymodactylos carnosus]|uniref:Uncharacterized protein n=1 Tax=Didymodactylos carnosus TaxID=1234261 RepID=A0A813SJE7_9BILA|nr:unnamed protein product [Didymodactylos carnosus]CAF3582680.1 unnamed protein product [Didymodactylos carnosus]